MVEAPKGAERGNGLFEEIVAENFLKFDDDMDINIQDGQ
jgi:hypothetical protein